MSTPDYDMAPPTATVTVPPPAAAQPQASGAAPATSSSTQPTQRRRTASQKNGELVGAILPGAVLGGLVSLCWLIHQFGLPAVALALLAIAVTTGTALVIKAGRRTAKSAARLGRGGRRGGGGAGPGGRSANRSGGGGGRRSAGGSGAGTRGGGRGGLGKQGGRGPGSRGTVPGALSRKPSGLGGGKSPFGLGGSSPKNSAARTLANTAGGSRPTAGPKSPKGSLFGGSSKKGGFAPHSSGRDAGPFGKGGGSKSNGLGGSGSNSTGPKNGKKKNKRNGTTPTAPGGGTPAGTTPGTTPGSAGVGTSGTAPAATPGAPKHRKASALGRRMRQLRRGAVKTAALVNRAYRATTSPKFRSKVRTAAKLPVKSVRAMRKFYRAATSLKVRNRLKKMVRPVKWSYGVGSKVLAHGFRWGRRAVMVVHSALGMVRSSTLGPNWLRPMARVLYWASTPLARLASASGSWGWLQGWIYKNATSRPAAPSGPAAGSTTAGSAPGAHQKVPAPTSAPSATGTPVSSSLSQHAYPLQRAREAIALARIAFAAAPADNMKGYEMVIQNLGLVNWSMAALMQTVANVTETEFRVNAAVPERFRWIAGQFITLGGFIDTAHQVYRQIHAEQIANIEQPTWQGRKWDISANWEDAIPTYSAWATDAIHAMPLQFAASAVLSAGHGIALYPGGSMFGYEATIEQLAPLATELYYLMDSVASVTEAEFRVDPAVTAMHRDAGIYFLGLGAMIQEAHHMYMTLHAEQIWNIKNPTAQGAKWDQARNV